MNTKDEIEKMLDDIKSSNTVKKNKYNDMSVDDLLNTISSSKKAETKSDSDISEKVLTADSILDQIKKSSEQYKSEISEISETSEIKSDVVENISGISDNQEVSDELEEPEISEIPVDIEKTQLESEPNDIIQDINNQDYSEAEEKTFRTIFNNILNESSEEIAKEKAEEPEPDEDYIREDDDSEDYESRPKGAKKTFSAVFGVIVFVFAVIGVISVVGFGIKYVRSFTDGENRQSEFIDAVYPAVIMDIEAFQNGSDLPSGQVITASVWKLIMSGDIERYDRTFDIISVPAVDIEAVATKLFDTEFYSLEHQTVGSGDLKFYYNEESKTYNIPAKPMLFSYKPSISALSKDGDIYTVEVDYIQEQPSFMKEHSKFDADVSKTVKFRLKLQDNDYSILSMQIINVNQE
ncbi:MAG: hypothetical protein K2G63_05795 [Oscillospiraceae bacterium]|nr:hypothetical protein [Oscillospiraceae bacterium]